MTATRTEAPASQVGASATVFTAEDLERRQVPLVADLLASTPGAMVIRSGAPGTLTSLFVRGGESDYNKVLLDGIPLNEPGGTFYLNNLTTENLDRIEIVRGAYSSLFGSDAMASVIQLFTKRRRDRRARPQGAVQIDGGTYGTMHANASVAGATSRVDYTGGVARFNSDNRVPNSGLENTTLSGNLGSRRRRPPRCGSSAARELEHVGTPGPTAFGRPDLDAFFERHDGVVSVAFDQSANGPVQAARVYSLAVSNQQSTNLVADPPYTATFEGRTAVSAVERLPRSTRRTISGGIMRAIRPTCASRHAVARRSAADAARRLGRRARDAGEPAGRHDDRELARQLRRRGAASDALAARVRHGRARGSSTTRTSAPPGAASAPSSTWRGPRPAAFGETRLKASAGTGIKEPTMLESFSLSPFFLGNPDLKPERSRSVEVGVEQRFAAIARRSSSTWFDNRFSDIISLRTDPATFEAQYFNIGVTARARPRAGTRGRTGCLRFAPAASYTLLDSEILESTSPGNVSVRPGQWAFRRPRHSGSAGVSVQLAAADRRPERRVHRRSSSTATSACSTRR